MFTACRLVSVSGRWYSFYMDKINAILDYLDTRKNELSNEMMAVGYHSKDYQELEGMYEVYSHLIAKIEDDFR